MKLLHRVVKSSHGINFSGTVSIDNTVIRRPVSGELSEDESEVTMTQEEINEHLRFYEQRLRSEHKKRMDELEAQKNQIITQAQANADQIESDAKASAVSIMEQAQKDGFNEGYEKGRQEATQKLSESLDAVKKMLDGLNSKKEELYIKNENELIDLAYEMAEKITLSELKTDKEIIFAIVKQACRNFRNSDYIKISLSECDVDKTVVSDKELIKSISNGIPEVEIEVLKDAESGTVLIDNDNEIVDASVGTQLDFLREVYNSGKKSLE